MHRNCCTRSNVGGGHAEWDAAEATSRFSRWQNAAGRDRGLLSLEAYRHGWVFSVQGPSRRQRTIRESMPGPSYRGRRPYSKNPLLQAVMPILGNPGEVPYGGRGKQWGHYKIEEWTDYAKEHGIPALRRHLVNLGVNALIDYIAWNDHNSCLALWDRNKECGDCEQVHTKVDASEFADVIARDIESELEWRGRQKKSNPFEARHYPYTGKREHTVLAHPYKRGMATTFKTRREAEEVLREVGATREAGYRVVAVKGKRRTRKNPDQCPACGGPLMIIGRLGSVDHYRCRNCGMDSNVHQKRDGVTAIEMGFGSSPLRRECIICGRPTKSIDKKTCGSAKCQSEHLKRAQGRRSNPAGSGRRRVLSLSKPARRSRKAIVIGSKSRRVMKKNDVTGMVSSSPYSLGQTVRGKLPRNGKETIKTLNGVTVEVEMKNGIPGRMKWGVQGWGELPTWDQSFHDGYMGGSPRVRAALEERKFKKNPEEAPFQDGEEISISKYRQWLAGNGTPEQLADFDKAVALQTKANSAPTKVMFRRLAIGAPGAVSGRVALVKYGETDETTYKAPKGSKKGKSWYKHKWEGKKVPILVDSSGKNFLTTLDPNDREQVISDWMRG